MNLILAIIWLLLTIGFFGWKTFTGNEGWQVGPAGNSISAGWLTLVLCIYNLVRWYSQRANRQESKEQFLARGRHVPHAREPVGDPDPNFDFTSDKPAAPRPNSTDQPPSNN